MATPTYTEQGARYAAQRDRVGHYFDRTAIEAWKAFATDAPVSRIRETVRRGRAEMRALMLRQLPADLSGRRVLDAGCGTGAMAWELAARGAEVTAVDLSPESVRYARENAPAEARGVRWVAGDMLDPSLGMHDAVVAMDSLIHYRAEDALGAIRALQDRCRRRVVLTHAPATRMLTAMHRVGKLFPRSDRSPAIQPVASDALRAALRVERTGERWAVGATRRVSSGFYTSQMLVLHRTGDSQVEPGGEVSAWH